MIKIEEININDITPANYNPRTISNDEFNKLTDSLNEFGLVDPIIINLQNMKIIGGHQRYYAIKKAGNHTTLNLIKLGDIGWVFLETDLKIKNEEYEKALNLSLNKISGEWDNNKLKSILTELHLKNFNIELTGFNNVELEELEIINQEDIENIPEDNYEYNNEIDCTVEYGDLYQLGKHRLICADSLQENNIKQLIGNNKIDIVWTDPFYDLDKDLLDYLNIFCQKHIFILNRDTAHAELIKKHYNQFKRFFVLTYQQPIWSGFSMQIPLINHTLIGHYTGKEAKTPKSVKGLSSVIHNSVLEDRTKEFTYGKPLKFITPFLKYYSNKGDNCLDLFGGSGSSLIACEELNRNCFISEIEPVNVENIINRWEQHTGKTAKKIN